MAELIIEFKNDQDREISLYLDDNDIMYFTYTEMGDTQHTKKILISELYDALRNSVDWKKKLEREQKDNEIRGWIDRCEKTDKQNTKLQDENSNLRSQIRSLKETIKIVGKK